VLLLIMGNCISLALYDPLQAEDSQHNYTLQQVGAQPRCCSPLCPSYTAVAVQLSLVPAYPTWLQPPLSVQPSQY
jgi:hypothetical protein